MGVTDGVQRYEVKSETDVGMAELKDTSRYNTYPASWMWSRAPSEGGTFVSIDKTSA